MPLLNYTTTVPMSRTIAQIHSLLVGAEARSVLTSYDGYGVATGMVFATETAAGPRHFSVPVDWTKVHRNLNEDPQVQARYCSVEHAQRVAWRIVKDWVEALQAIAATEMVTLDQVMLPYMVADTDGSTVYDLYVSKQLALGTG